jgi:hypothetical protein
MLIEFFPSCPGFEVLDFMAGPPEIQPIRRGQVYFPPKKVEENRPDPFLS